MGPHPSPLQKEREQNKDIRTDEQTNLNGAAGALILLNARSALNHLNRDAVAFEPDLPKGREAYGLFGLWFAIIF